MEYKTILLDPQSQSKTRCVFRIEAGEKFYAKRLRVVNFGLSNSVGDQVYYGHNGIYSLISKISVLNNTGTEIDRLQGYGLDIMGIRLSKMTNSSEFSIGRQLSQHMCSSIFCPSFSQTTLTEKAGADDSSLMGNSLYIDVSFMLSYLQSRTIIDEGMTILIQWKDASVLGYDYEFTRPPALAYDTPLDPMVKADDATEFGFTTIIDDHILMQQLPSFDRRLNSFYNQYIRNLYYYNIGRRNNTLGLPLSRPNEQVQLQINGMKLLPLKGNDTDSKKLYRFTEFSGVSSITHYQSYVDGINALDGLHNPNLGLTYANTVDASGNYLGAVYSWGCLQLDRSIGSDLTISYQSDLAQGSSGTIDGDTVVFLAEVMRAYNKKTGIVRFVGV